MSWLDCDAETKKIAYIYDIDEICSITVLNICTSISQFIEYCIRIALKDFKINFLHYKNTYITNKIT